ncbi:MAG: hypothetical protein J6Y85_02700 [Alphaproteobacteria bacterium]|nr:hypothetical protein [Alphaproteobacteria bacterium]
MSWDSAQNFCAALSRPVAERNIFFNNINPMACTKSPRCWTARKQLMNSSNFWWFDNEPASADVCTAYQVSKDDLKADIEPNAISRRNKRSALCGPYNKIIQPCGCYVEGECDTPCLIDQETCGCFDNSCPNSCTKWDWLQATGSQYIDTKYIGTSNFKVEALVSWHQKTGTWQEVLGARDTNKSSDRFSITFNTNQGANNPFLGYNIGNQSNDALIAAALDTKYHFTANKDSFTVNGSSYNVNATLANGKYSIFLFAVSQKGSPIQTNFHGKIYYVKFYDNETLVLDFIPVTDVRGRPAMYDQVSKTLFYNVGSGKFETGNDS